MGYALLDRYFHAFEGLTVWSSELLLHTDRQTDNISHHKILTNINQLSHSLSHSLTHFHSLSLTHTVPERRDSLPRSFPRWKTYDPWRSEENLAGIPHFKGQSGKKWRVADPHWPPQKTERQVDVHKEEPPVDIFLQLASVSKDGGGVKVCDLLHSGNVRVHDALWGPGQFPTFFAIYT